MKSPNTTSSLTRDQLLALVDSGNRLSTALELNDVLQSILQIGCKLTRSAAASVILHDPRYDDLYFAAATGPAADDLPSIRIPPGQGKAGRVYTTREPLIENDLASTQDHYKLVDEQTNFTTRSMVCVPLVFRDRCYGVVQILNKANGDEPYDDRDLELLEALAMQSAIAIHNSMLFENMLASGGLYAERSVRQDILDYLTSQDVPATQEFLSVLFADMRGFTQLCAVMGEPKRIHALLSQFLSMLARTVVEHHGIVNKFLGDGVMGIFRGEAASTNAVRAAFSMTSSFEGLVSAWNETTNRSLRFLDIGVGIASDETILGSISIDEVNEFTVIGTSVNLAAALEHDARGGKRVLCDQLTYQRAHDVIQSAEGPFVFTLQKKDQKVPIDFDIFHLTELRRAHDGKRVFVSYDHHDTERVREGVVEPLQQHGVDVFFSSQSIAPAEDFAETIGSALEDAGWFIVVVTTSSVNSKWVREEVKYALEAEHLERRVLAVRLDDVNVDQLDWRLRRRLYIDAFGSARAKGLQSIVDTVEGSDQ